MSATVTSARIPRQRRRIYVASSWRNQYQPGIVSALLGLGHLVYDFRNPAPGDNGFGWGEMDRRWQEWSPSEFRSALDHPVAIRGFGNDWSAMQWADTGVLVLPCGRSAHLEAGYFIGAGKELWILLGDQPLEPELMYRMATGLCLDMAELAERLAVPIQSMTS